MSTGSTYRMRLTQRCVMALIGMALLGRTHVGHAEDRVTDEVIQGAFGKSHDVMKEQRHRLQAILNGFLSSDIDAIQHNADELAKAMQQVMASYPPEAHDESQDEAQQWEAIADIIKRAGQLKTSVAEGKYQQAYARYSALVGRCIACHQARRTWRFIEEHPQEQQGGAPMTAMPPAQAKPADQP